MKTIHLQDQLGKANRMLRVLYLAVHGLDSREDTGGMLDILAETEDIIKGVSVELRSMRRAIPAP